jgi:hypothetical protein
VQEALQPIACRQSEPARHDEEQEHGVERPEYNRAQPTDNAALPMIVPDARRQPDAPNVMASIGLDDTSKQLRQQLPFAVLRPAKTRPVNSGA